MLESKVGGGGEVGAARLLYLNLDLKLKTYGWLIIICLSCAVDLKPESRVRTDPKKRNSIAFP